MNQTHIQQFETIADALAEEGIAVINDFINADEVKLICSEDDFKEGSLRFKKAGIGKLNAHHINESVRGDYIQWIDPDTASTQIQTYLQKISQLRTFLNEGLFISLKDFEVHKTIYPPGSFYKRHLDQFKKDDHRKLSVILYLNEDWDESDGGQLRVYFSNREKDFFPIGGRLICFRSDLLEHEVLPTHRARMSLTGWMLDQDVGLKHL